MSRFANCTVAFLLLLAGCNAPKVEDETCSSIWYCDIGFVCIDGVCVQSPEAVDGSAPDAASTMDGGGQDAGSRDAAMSPDAGAPDAAVPSDGPVDGGAVDSGSVDSGPVDAGSFDAGPCICADCTTPGIVFVSSSLSTGSMGGLSGADAECNRLALAAGLPGSYTAWMSVPGAHARDRVGGGGPWYLKTGTLVACDVADLLDMTLGAPINVTETGGSAPSVLVWTGTKADGTVDTHADHDLCSGWNSAVFSPEALVGRSDSMASAFTASQTGYCHRTFSIYCFQTGP